MFFASDFFSTKASNYSGDFLLRLVAVFLYHDFKPSIALEKRVMIWYLQSLTYKAFIECNFMQFTLTAISVTITNVNIFLFRCFYTVPTP